VTDRASEKKTNRHIGVCPRAPWLPLATHAMEIYVEGLGRILPEVQGSGTKAKKPQSVPDLDRAQGPDKGDPRYLGEGPCGQDHGRYRQCGNMWGQWKFCTKCGLRVMYVPYRNAPGECTEVLKPELVRRALEVLRTCGIWENMTSGSMRCVVDFLKRHKDLDLPRETWLLLLLSKVEGTKKKGGSQESGQGRPPRAVVKMAPAAADVHEAASSVGQPEHKLPRDAVHEESRQMRRELQELRDIVEQLRLEWRGRDSSPSATDGKAPEAAQRGRDSSPSVTDREAPEDAQRGRDSSPSVTDGKAPQDAH
jgi:hypothetical protein